MKSAIHAFLVFFYCLFGLKSAQAEVCTAIASGNWSAASTWSCGHAPANNDTMVIPLLFVVTVDINSPTYVNMVINVSGDLNFGNGQKINMDCGGQVNVFAGGELTGGTPGSKINICGATVWNGGGVTPGPLTFGTGPLPVAWLDVSAENYGNTQVMVIWSTATETNNQYFTVERSLNATVFTPIGGVAGAGTSSSVNSYSYLDETPLNGILYYRIKQIDYNGNYSYSRIVAIDYNSNQDGNCHLFVSPNPCSGNCSILFGNCAVGFNVGITVQVFNILGENVLTKEPESRAGLFYANIDASELKQNGIYFVRVISAEGTYSARMVIRAGN